MSLKYKYVLTCMGKSISMVWILLYLLLHEVKLVYAVNSITITSSTCGNHYSTNFYKTVKVEHYGSSVLNSNPCSVEFTKTSTDQYLCVSREEIKLDCGTSLEYHKGFVKNDGLPERIFTCRSSVSRDDWCPSQYEDTIYIVIKKSAQYSSDVIKLRVYLKDVQDLGFSIRIVLYTLIPIVVVVIIVIVAICARKRAVKASRGHPQVAYQTTSGAVNTQAGQSYGSPYQTTTDYQPVQQGGQQQLPELQGSFNIHPVQTAYPVQQGSTPAQNNTTEISSYGQQYPNGQGYGSSYPTTTGYQPVQQAGQQQLPELQGNFNIHPVQTAYPIQQGSTPAQNITTEGSSYGQQYPNEPTVNTAAPPPSYESVVGTKH